MTRTFPGDGTVKWFKASHQQTVLEALCSCVNLLAQKTHVLGGFGLIITLVVGLMNWQYLPERAIQKTMPSLLCYTLKDWAGRWMQQLLQESEASVV